MISDKEIRVVVGAGPYINNPGWIHTQAEDLNLLKREDWSRKFQRESVTAILAEHVWEHLTYEEGIKAARLCFEYLKPGGHIRCAVPDAFCPNPEYQQAVQVGGPGPRDHPAASHQIVYNYHTLIAMFTMAGFETTLLEYYDEQGQFHHQSWDEKDGVIYRSLPVDPRIRTGEFASLMVDAIKPTPFDN
ncbi:class I SAM-dependent methyltransferase [Marininema halotolerans]|uniref:Predicted SAM-depedendent methyltransferase n=1 Tax=Marininema halotolerans TaxID=1155944 RepID=A0A1I6PCM3_9BACL|nr:SAM-dependent methyltransferase [Marininema halotolerans]SFS37957.1 Predicted SAM-depedendent methyltransferase [Marininema halotolerans]